MSERDEARVRRARMLCLDLDSSPDGTRPLGTGEQVAYRALRSEVVRELREAIDQEADDVEVTSREWVDGDYDNAVRFDDDGNLVWVHQPFDAPEMVTHVTGVQPLCAEVLRLATMIEAHQEWLRSRADELEREGE